MERIFLMDGDLGDANSTAARETNRDREALRLVVCGDDDAGIRALIGLLASKGSLPFELSTRKHFALPFDGLCQESGPDPTGEDCGRCLVGKRRAFIIAETPSLGDLAAEASRADMALLLVDASLGVTARARRHGLLLSLLGVRRAVVAIDRMDRVGWEQARFDAIAEEYGSHAGKLGIADIAAIPISAATGDNILDTFHKVPWYRGPSLLRHLDTVDAFPDASAATLRLPVQWVYRTDGHPPGYSGTVASGVARVGDAVAVLPSGRTTEIAAVAAAEDTRSEFEPGQKITITLSDEFDLGRGDLIVAAGDRPPVADQFAGHLVWMASAPLLPGRRYILYLGPLSVGVQVTVLKHKINADTLEHVAAKHLDTDEIGFCNFALDRAIPFDPYAVNRATGGFTIVDRVSNAAVGFGTIAFPLRRALNVHWQHTDVDKAQRSALMGQAPCVLWFTGLSGAGKSAVANMVEKKLLAMGRHTYLLDGDNVRHGLNKDLGFTAEDRVENIRRIAECAKLFADAGLIVLTAFISPFRAERRMARDLITDCEFFEIFIDTPLAVCERRDPKGLYKKARAGELPNFTGIDSPYERPEAPELTLDGATLSAEEMADRIIELLDARLAT